MINPQVGFIQYNVRIKYLEARIRPHNWCTRFAPRACHNEKHDSGAKCGVPIGNPESGFTRFEPIRYAH